MQAARVRARGRSSDELAVIAQRAQAFTNASGTAIALSKGNAGEIICRACTGSSAPEVGTALRVEGTFTGLCIQSGKELRCDDAETDTRVDKAAIRALGIRSMVAIPIKDEGRVVGVLAAFAPTAHAFKMTHVAVLKTMADEIAAYLQSDEGHSPEPLPAPPVKALAVATAPVPPPAVVIKPAEPASTHGQHPPQVQQHAPKVEVVRAITSAEEIDSAPVSKEKETLGHEEQKEESQTDFRPAFGTLDAAAAPEKRPNIVLMIGAAAVVVIAVAIGLSFKLRRPDPASQPAVETLSSPGTLGTPPAKNTPPAPPAKHDEVQPKREEAQRKREGTVVLAAGPSRISQARGNSAPLPEAPALSLGSVSTSGSLLNLPSPVSQPPHPRLLMQSELEPVRVIKKVLPVYPLVARQNGLRGSVVVQGTVDKNGRISDLQQISGSPVFRRAAFEALKQWVFQPARLDGQAIDQSTKIRLDFSVR